MELRHIRYLIAAGEEEHFGRAADRLNVTRSAVSQIVADLEAELGFQLFERQAQKIRLTAAGRAMLPRLNAIMNELNATIAMGRRVGQGLSGLLKVGYGSLSTHHPVFRAAVKKFHDDLPDVALSLMEIPTSRQLKAMRDGVIQAGFVHFGPDARLNGRTPEHAEDDAKDVHACVIDVASLGLIVPADHALASRGQVRLSELENEPLVMIHHSRPSPLFGHFFRLCAAAGFEPRIIQEVSATGTQQDLVAAGVGIGISVVGGRHEYPPQLRALPIVDIDYPVTFELCWMGGHVEPALERLIDRVKSLSAR